MNKFYATRSTPLHRTHLPTYHNCIRWTAGSSCSLSLSSQNKSLKLNLHQCTSNLSTTGNFLSFSLLKNSISFRVRAVSEQEEENGAAAVIKSKWVSTLQLIAMFGVWYSLNIYFNIYNKQVLKVFPYAATLTALQFGCGTLMVLIMWSFNLHPTPKLKRSQVVYICISNRLPQ